MFGAAAWPLLAAFQELKVNAGRGDVSVWYPDSHNSAASYPLVVLLPGYSDSYPSYTRHFGLQQRIDTDGLIQVMALGRFDAFNHQYWMAWGDWTGTCNPAASYTYSYWYGGEDRTPDSVWSLALQYCGGADDDVLYLRSLISEVQSHLQVDASAISVLGQSNGVSCRLDTFPKICLPPIALPPYCVSTYSMVT